MVKTIGRLWLAAMAGVIFAQPAMAAKAVNIDINPEAGYSTPGASDNAVYVYSIFDGQAVNDTIDVQVCMTGYETGWTSVDVSFGTPNGGLPGVTVPANQTFYASTTTLPDCRNVAISIATGALASGVAGTTYVSNIQLADANPSPSTGSSKPQVTFADIKKIQIQVNVQPNASSNVNCFLTDSEGNFLTDCAGVPVAESGSDDGRFAIIANKRGIEVATNPGQFYYNLVWWNKTGVSQTVDVDMLRTGVNPHGQQALHAAVFNGYLDPLTPDEFALANADGIPEGHDDAVAGVEVPAGASLLVTYHLQWAGLGDPVPAGCAGTCAEANQLISVTGTVSGTGIATEDCTAEAYGYKKK